MESKVNYALVGIFTIVLTIAIIFAIIWLSSGFSKKEYNTYKVYMEESVTGLNVDSPVKYNGVDVGKVKRIKLNHANPRQVELLIDVEEGAPINKSTTATLTTQGLTGVAYIDLQTKGLDTTPLTQLPGQHYPVIKSAPSLFFRLDKALSELITNFNNLSISVNSVLDVENRRALKETLIHLRILTTSLANNTKHFDEIIQSSQTTMHTISTQTMPKVNDILNNVQTITNNLTITSQNLKQNPSILLRGQSPHPPGPGEK